MKSIPKTNISLNFYHLPTSAMFDRKANTTSAPATLGGSRGDHAPPPHHPTFFFVCVCVAKEKGKQRKKRNSFKAETIKTLSPRSKCYCFSYSRASRIQKLFLSVNLGGRQYISVFHAPSILKSILLALNCINNKTTHLTFLLLF